MRTQSFAILMSLSLLPGLIPAEGSPSPQDPVLTSPTAQSQDPATPLSDDGVVVTATRYQAQRDTLPQRMDLISRQQIDATQADEFTDILKKNTSVDVIEYPGALSGIGLRGFAPNPYANAYTNKALILIDGHPAGTANLATLNSQAVDHIELLKGPASALYGSEAVAGVLNVITKKTHGPLQGSASVAAGSFDTVEGALTAGGTLWGPLDFDASWATRERMASTKGAAGRDIPDSTFLVNQAALRLGTRLLGDWRADLAGQGYFGRRLAFTDSDQLTYANVSAYKDLDRLSGDFKLEGPVLGTRATVTLFAGRETYDVVDSLASQSDVYYTSTSSDVLNQGAQLKDLVAFGQQQIVFGLDWRSVAATTALWAVPTDAPDYKSRARKQPYNPDSAQDSLGVYTQAGLHFWDGLLDLSLGARTDSLQLRLLDTPYSPDYSAGEQSYASFNPSAGVQVSPLSWLKLHSTVGRAYSSPEAKQLAGSTTTVLYDASWNPYNATYKSNPNLRPEISVTWDAGLALVSNAHGLRADLTYFSTAITDKTQQVLLDTVTHIYSYQNLSGTTEIRGIEGELSQDFGALFHWGRQVRLFGNFTTILKAKQLDSTSTQAIDILNIADQKVQTGADYDDGRFNARVAARYRGTVLDNYVVYVYPPLWVWDLSLAFSLTPAQTLSLQVANLADIAYYEKAGYPMPGRNYTLRSTWRF